MHLHSLDLIQFKNLRSPQLRFSRGVNCFVGDNGSGKTNVLDAIHYLSMCKSAFTMTDGQTVQHGCDFFVADGSYRLPGERKESVVCSFRKGAGKIVKRNGKEYDKLSDHVGLLPLVLVSPADTALINDAADERRRFMNALLAQMDREYLHSLLRYNHVLAERNRLLKDTAAAGGADILEVLDMQLADLGAVIYARRRELVEQLLPLVQQHYRFLSDDREQVALRYRSDLDKGNLYDLLALSREKDTVMGHTTVGVHRDDIKMQIMEHPIRKYGSQGQQKSFLIALKLAQYDLLRAKKEMRPLLLLDDVFDKLDLQRVENLIRLVSGASFGQIFITDSNKVRLDSMLKKITKEYGLFSVSDGEIQMLG